MKVLISGYYGYGNLGDEAILSALVSELRNYNYKVTVLSAAPAATRNLHKVKATHRYWGFLPALLNHDALISGGGGLLQDKTSLRSLHYYLGIIKLAKWLGKRVVVYGQSIGPLSKKGKVMVANTLKGIPVAVRDKASRDLLTSLGIESFLTADTALLLPIPIPVKCRSKILLIPRANYSNFTQELIEIGKAFKAENIPIAALIMHPHEDLQELNALKENLPSLEVLKAETPKQALEHIAKAQYVISVRLHGLILAAKSRTPFRGMVYDPKVAAFLQEVEAEEHPLPLTLKLTMEEAVDLAALKQLKERAKKGIGWLDSVLRG